LSWNTKYVSDQPSKIFYLVVSKIPILSLVSFTRLELQIFGLVNFRGALCKIQILSDVAAVLKTVEKDSQSKNLKNYVKGSVEQCSGAVPIQGTIAVLV